MIASAVVWDQTGVPPATTENILCWRSYDRHESVSSVPQYLEDHADRLRGKYLAFIHELGEHQVAGKRVIDHLDMGDGFSLWWMTHLAEKSPFKSPRIYDCLRLLALEEILIASRPAGLTLVSSDAALGKAIRHLCQNLGIRFRARLMRSSKKKNPLRSVYDALPPLLQGFLSIRHILVLWPLRKMNRPQWFSHENAVFICSYFIHLDPIPCARGEFHSRQWERLPKVLKDSGRPTNWIQLFMFSSEVPDLATGICWLEKFNQDANNQGVHRFLQSYLTVRRLLSVLWNWTWLIIVRWRLRDIQSAFNVRGTAVWLWPILRADWYSSLSGPVALSNCVWITLFDAALADMPTQKVGLYLCENQSWEKAFLRAWRKYGHGKIIGVQHSTVPFWHLYYFDDKRSYARSCHCALPTPDHLAVNGAGAWQAFVAGSFPAERLAEVEALRYLNLSGIMAKGGEDRVRRHMLARSRSEATRVNVIVLGDMVPASMHHLLRLLEEASKLLPTGYRFTFKPHPGYSVRLADYPGLQADETKKALGEILGAYDVAVAANSTSASVDAYLAGVPVIIGLDGNALNLSPLRGRHGVRFVSTCDELADALQTTGSGAEIADSDRKEFFFLDSDLPRWKRLLAF